MCVTCSEFGNLVSVFEHICDLKKLSVCRVGHFRGNKRACLVTLKADPPWTEEKVFKLNRYLGHFDFKTNDEMCRMLSPSLMEIMISFNVSVEHWSTRI